MQKNYDHFGEDEIYQKWEESGEMRADAKSAKPPFTIPLPPPNVTGQLHLGHAAMLAIEDILIRFKKMTGHEVLWVPGTDHAAIATENVVIKHLGLKSREELSREDFLAECRKFAGEKHDTIIGQTKKMGSWLDWSREAYTFDEERNHAVNTIFAQLFKDGLIERGHRMINWSVGAKSVLSDDELEWEEREEPFYYIRCGEFIIGTVRSETKCADSPVVIHPDGEYVRAKFTDSQGKSENFILSKDLFENTKKRSKMLNLLDPEGTWEALETKKGKEFVGQQFKYETYAGNRKFYVIADDKVIDIKKGTGAMTISCNHSADDYDLGKRLGLNDYFFDKIDFEGNMTAITGPCEGLSIEKARKESAKIMKEKGLLVGEEKTYLHRTPLCYRSGCVVEPMISPQWFVVVEKEFETNHLQKFIYARHGQTDANLKGIIQGANDSLNQKGREHAKDLAKILKDKKIVKIISSSHLRAKETVEIVAKELGIKNVEFWNEFDGGDYGKLTGTIITPKQSAIELAEEMKTGETGEQIFTRVKQGFEKLKDEKEKGEILVVAHRTIFSVLDGLENNEDASSLVKNRLKNEEKGHGIWKELDLVSNKRIKTTLKKLTADAVREGHVKIIPERFNKIYFQWIDNLRDWCISRQIWWGHRIPVFYCEKCGSENVFLKADKTNVCEKCKSKDLRQDKDTLDTWFSSASWPFSTIGWPNIKDPDFQKFYPNDVLETGHDILFFWVARMIMFGRYATGKYPFKNVYLHGLVCDEHGKKMSKSKGNGIDPLDMISEFGADPVRLALVIGSSPGQKIPIGKEKIAGYRNFVNKLWNAGRFVQMQLEDEDLKDFDKQKFEPKTIAEKWILSRFATVSSEIKNHLDKFEISHAGEKMYHFVWDEFCDWYLEASKVEDNLRFLTAIFFEIITLVHPFCPFVTDKLYEEFWGKKEMTILRNFPSVEFEDVEAEKIFTKIQKTVFEIRRIRADEKINPKEKLLVEVADEKISEEVRRLIENLGGVKIKSRDTVPRAFTDATKIIIDDWEIAVKIPVDENRQKAEIARLEGEIKNFEGRLNNKKYVENAPKVLVDETKTALESAKEKLGKMK